MKLAILSTLLAAAAAFQAPVAPSVRPTVAMSETKADLEALAGKLNPLVKFYDPLNLAEAEFWGASNEATIGFLRHAEIKHGRVAMFAFVGYIAHANGVKWPWAMQMDGTPFPTETNPPQLWDSISDSAKWQVRGEKGEGRAKEKRMNCCSYDGNIPITRKGTICVLHYGDKLSN